MYYQINSNGNTKKYNSKNSNKYKFYEANIVGEIFDS